MSDTEHCMHRSLDSTAHATGAQTFEGHKWEGVEFLFIVDQVANHIVFSGRRMPAPAGTNHGLNT